MSGTTIGNTVTLTFTGGPVDFGSLADGRYTLKVLTSQAVDVSGQQLDGNNDDTGGDNFVLVGDTAVNKLYRLFGDADGDGDVDLTDFSAFKIALGSSGFGGAYNAAFDNDGDGDVDLADFGRFKARMGVVL